MLLMKSGIFEGVLYHFYRYPVDR